MCKNEEMLLLLSGHADGCNTPEEEARLQAHLAECPDCRRVLEEYEAMDAAIAGLPLAMPENFTANVMRAVEAEPRKAEAKKPRRFTFGFATAAAAVAAIMLLAIGSGKLPIPGNTSARLNIFPSKSAESPAAEEYAAQEPASEPEAAPAEAKPGATLQAPAVASGPMAANVACAALARAENRPVGVLYADPAELTELVHAPSLPLDGGMRYEIDQKTLYDLAVRFADLQIYEPDGFRPQDDAPAYLIVVQ